MELLKDRGARPQVTFQPRVSSAIAVHVLDQQVSQKIRSDFVKWRCPKMDYRTYL
jgi:hypothetical protein